MKNGRRKAAVKDSDRRRDIGEGPDDVQREERDRRFRVQQPLPRVALALSANRLREIPSERVVVVPRLDDLDGAQMLELRNPKNVMRLELHRQEFVRRIFFDPELDASPGGKDEAVSRPVPIGAELLPDCASASARPKFHEK
jgi:hypothetical protein